MQRPVARQHPIAVRRTRNMTANTGGLQSTCSPDQQLEMLLRAKRLEVRAVAGDDGGSYGATGQRDQRIEMEIAKLPRVVAALAAQPLEQRARASPLPDSGEKHLMLCLELVYPLSLARQRGAATQLREHDSRVAY